MFARPGLCGMGIGRLGLVAASQPSLVAQALAIIAKYGSAANLYLPGVGAINGITAGNWLDSAGTTAATVDNPVGLVVSAGKAAGPNVFSDGSVTFGGGSSRVSTGVYRIYSSAGAYSNVTQTGNGIQPNKTYRLRFNVDSIVYGALAVEGPAGNVVPSITAGTGEKECVIAMTSTALISIKRASGATDIQISNLRIEELTGTHLTQATTANKPVLRRGLVNLLTYSHDMTGWTGSFTRNLEVGIGPNGRNAWRITATPTPSVFTRPFITATSTTVTMAAIHKAGTFTGNTFLIRNLTTATNLSSTTTSQDVGTGWALTTRTATSGITIGDQLSLYFGTGSIVPDGQFWYIEAGALYAGAVTAQQIIDAGGIPITTTAPASSTTGPWAHQFDGADDSFGTTLTPGNAGFVCVGANFYDNNLRTVLGAGAGAATGEPGVWVARNGAGLQLFVSDGAARQIVSTAYPGATNAVASAGWSADSMMVGANNTEAAAAKTLNCATAAKQIAIGAYSAGGSTAPMLGTISGGAIIMPTVLPTSSERAILRQFIASLSGVTM